MYYSGGLAVDIDAMPPAKEITILLPTDTAGPPPYKAIKTATAETPATAEVSDDESVPSSTEDSDVGEAAENYIHEHMGICKSVTLISGKSKTARVHMLGADKTNTTGVLTTWCGTKVNSYTAQLATADRFLIDMHQPCRKCRKSWPDTITSLFHNIEPEKPENGNQDPDNFKNLDDSLW